MRHALRHVTSLGCGLGCGEIAWYLDHKPTLGERLSPVGVTFLDGTPAKFGDRIICRACGKPMEAVELHPDNFEPAP